MIKAIETHYRGCHFRSRLEARWAVFFDTFGIAWEYEKEGFELPSGRYLPDFWLPRVQIGCWFEVKGLEPNVAERMKALELARGTGFPVYIFDGSIESGKVVDDPAPVLPEPSRLTAQPSGIGFFPQPDSEQVSIYDDQRFGICRTCRSVNIVGGGAPCYFPCGESSGLTVRSNLEKLREPTPFQQELLSRRCPPHEMPEADVRRLKHAFDAARAARFEFGEAGRQPQSRTGKPYRRVTFPEARDITRRAWATQVRDWWFSLAPTERPVQLSADYVAIHALGIKAETVNSKIRQNIGFIMRDLRFDKKRIAIDGTQHWFYVPTRALIEAPRAETH